MTALVEFAKKNLENALLPRVWGLARLLISRLNFFFVLVHCVLEKNQAPCITGPNIPREKCGGSIKLCFISTWQKDWSGLGKKANWLFMKYDSIYHPQPSWMGHLGRPCKMGHMHVMSAHDITHCIVCIYSVQAVGTQGYITSEVAFWSKPLGFHLRKMKRSKSLWNPERHQNLISSSFAHY